MMDNPARPATQGPSTAPAASPADTQASTTPPTSQEEEFFDATPPLPSLHQPTASRIAPPMDQPTTSRLAPPAASVDASSATTRPSYAEAAAASVAAIPLPPFYTHDPRLWFIQVAMEMEGVTELGNEFHYVRSLQDVNAVVNHAKLSRSDLKRTSQVLYFASEFPEYKLLECDGALLNHLESGGELYVRGQPADKAVVCTADTTYDLKSAETSNSLLLVPGLKMAEDVPAEDNKKGAVNEEEDGAGGEIEEKRIMGVYGEYFELKKMKPRMGRLRTLLSARPYNGPENEVDVSEEVGEERTYTFEDILEQVQASEGEIRKHLDDLEALEIQGRWRMLNHEYQFRALSFLLNLVEENSWPPDGVPIGETTSTLNGLVPDAILEHILRIYLQPTDEFNEDGDKLYRLSEFKVCRFLGESLLRPVDKFNLQEFLNAWSSSVPSGLVTDLKQLDGLALYDDNTNPPVIWYYPEHKLPEDLSERFALLFQERKAWALEQIAPYVSSFATEKQTVNALLTKHARSANVGGRKMYSSRHGK